MYVQVINRQLHTSGVLDALRVARTGFPDRIPFQDFAATFANLYKGAKVVLYTMLHYATLCFTSIPDHTILDYTMLD